MEYPERNDEDNIPQVNEPIADYGRPVSFDDVWKMFQETDKMFKETDRKFEEIARRFKETVRQFKETDRQFKETDRQFKETDRQFKETDRKFQETDKSITKRMKEIHEELGGIGKSNGEIAEDFFYTGLAHSMSLAGMNFDIIDRNYKRKRNNLEAEYDIILYNDYKVLIVEVKYRYKVWHLRLFFNERLKKFTSLFPQYKGYKIYGAIAGMTFEKGVIEEAKKFGFYIITQDNNRIQVINDKDFQPNEIK